MTGITDDMRAKMQSINANLSHTRRCSSATRHFVYNGKEVVEVDRAPIAANHSMFPYKSSAMAVDPSEVPAVVKQLRKQGLFTEFDSAGRPIIESAKQQAALATALGLKTGRDGYGHLDEYGKFQNSGRRRADEIAQGRGRVRRAIQELKTMPEEMPADAVVNALREYDIIPSEENTG
jgi:hypothetical protein